MKGMRTNVLFVEKSIGVSGSTVSLANLLPHLDPARFGAYVATSRPDQLAYILKETPDIEDGTVIAPGRSPKNRSSVRAMISGLERRSPSVRRLAQSGVAGAELVSVTVPYGLRLYRFARRRNVALMHQNNGFDTGALLAARLLKVPLVAYQRGDEWSSPLVRRLARSVDRYIANSHATRRSLVELGVGRDRVEVIYPPVDLETFAPVGVPRLHRSDFGVVVPAPCFGIVGMLLPWKGQDVFLRAAQAVMARVPSARAFVVGDSPEGHATFRQELRRLAAELGILDRVVFTGFRRDVADILRILDVVAHTSVAPEPFGRVIVEAMAMGKPVVASRAGGPLEIIEDGRTGFLVTPGDVQALAARIVTLLQDRPLADRIAEAGRREVTDRFSARRHAELVQSVYADVLDGLPGAPRRVAVGRAPVAGG
jgi:glycosyltransferase involved in cell wall biosynthesis